MGVSQSLIGFYGALLSKHYRVCFQTKFYFIRSQSITINNDIIKLNLQQKPRWPCICRRASRRWVVSWCNRWCVRRVRRRHTPPGAPSGMSVCCTVCRLASEPDSRAADPNSTPPSSSPLLYVFHSTAKRYIDIKNSHSQFKKIKIKDSQVKIKRFSP